MKIIGFSKGSGKAVHVLVKGENVLGNVLCEKKKTMVAEKNLSLSDVTCKHCMRSAFFKNELAKQKEQPQTAQPESDKDTKNKNNAIAISKQKKAPKKQPDSEAETKSKQKDAPPLPANKKQKTERKKKDRKQSSKKKNKQPAKKQNAGKKQPAGKTKNELIKKEEEKKEAEEIKNDIQEDKKKNIQEQRDKTFTPIKNDNAVIDSDAEVKNAASWMIKNTNENPQNILETVHGEFITRINANKRYRIIHNVSKVVFFDNVPKKAVPPLLLLLNGTSPFKFKDNKFINPDILSIARKILCQAYKIVGIETNLIEPKETDKNGKKRINRRNKPKAKKKSKKISRRKTIKNKPEKKTIKKQSKITRRNKTIKKKITRRKK